MMKVEFIEVVAPAWQSSGGTVPFVVAVKNTGDEST